MYVHHCSTLSIEMSQDENDNRTKTARYRIEVPEQIFFEEFASKAGLKKFFEQDQLLAHSKETIPNPKA